MNRPHILIVGTGSAGKRHAANLHRLGCSISCMDPRQDRLDDMTGQGVHIQGGWRDLAQALDAGAYDGAVIASPPCFHVEQAMHCLQVGLPVLLEKPVAPDLESAMRLAHFAEQTGVPVLLGYTWRWWPSLIEARQRVLDGAVGKVLHVHFCMSAHLADWHPWEAYQDFFMASKALGGGALLDESHWIDQMLWFFGLPSSITGEASTIGGLDIDTDDNVDIQAVYDSGLRITLHLDLYGRPHEKSITVRGSEGTLQWFVDGFRIGRSMDALWEETHFQNERNDMFVAVAKEFLGVLSGALQPSCTLDDGLRVLHVIESVRKSGERGARMNVGKP